MSLTFGNSGMPANWGFPSALYNYKTGQYDAGGIIWYGRKPAGPAAKKALRDRFGQNVRMDELSLVGMDSPVYSTFHTANVNRGNYKPPLFKPGKK